MARSRSPFRTAALLCAFALSACNGAGQSLPGGPALQGDAHGARPGASSSKIQHVIIMIQENRSFNEFFATFPGATGATSGFYLKQHGKTYVKTPVTLKETTLAALDFNHNSTAYNFDCDGKGYTYPKTSCDMDGFNLEGVNGNNPAMTQPYQYVNPDQIAPYWFIAKNYGLADHLFQTQGSGSFTAHQDLVHGDTFYPDSNCPSGSQPTCSLIDFPTTNGNWGCNAPPDSVTQLLTIQGKYLQNAGPYPCLTYPDKTMADLLDAAGVSWKYYTPPYKSRTNGALWDAMAAIKGVYDGPDWKKNVSIPQSNVLLDIQNGTLPAVSWVIPTQMDSDHPHAFKAMYHGPEWIASVVNAVGKSKLWDSTAIIVTWDDWGGFFDPVPPAFFDDQGGLGFRVPMLVVSPYTKKGTLSHTQYEFASILRFVEENFNLGQMGTPSFPNNDARAASIGDMFSLTMKPRKFVPVPASLDANYFLREPLSYEPLDRE
jgi:phospholipase C